MGFLACSADIANDIANIKILTSVSSSEYAERTVDTLLAERHHLKYLEELRSKLEEATGRAYDLLDDVGATIFVRPERSLFIWAQLPGVSDTQKLAHAMLNENIVMAPGNIFSVNPNNISPWTRCNPHAVLDPRFRRALDKLLG